MTKIIGISGKKQSGKNTVGNIISGDIMLSMGMVQDYNVNDSGQLIIKTQDKNNNIGWGIFDLLRKDEDFKEYADSNIWPYVKIYHFADYLKQMCVELFDLKPSQVYGTDEDKNTETQYSRNGWNHKMTARDFLQYFGTEIMREIKDTVWVDHTIKKIENESPIVSIIPDVRFPNEVHAIKEAGGLVIRLTRSPSDSDHQCEKALDKENFDWDKFDYVVENNNCSVGQLKEKIVLMNHLWRN
jgi:hypothetical protein